MITVSRRKVGLALGGFVLALGAWIGGRVQQATMNGPTIVVCHSAQEDSTITDCDYSHGTWLPKGK